MIGAARDLAAAMRYELVPMKGVEAAAADLPQGVPVSVTCSPVRGLGPTLDLCEALLDRGHHTVPHLSARMVESAQHLCDVVAWLRSTGVRHVFVIAGDAPEPRGPFHDGLALLRALLDLVPALDAVGVPGYPDGHAFVPDDVVAEALLAKQELLAEAGCAASVTTQMCFDPTAVRGWLADMRARGLEAPVHLGIPGVVSRTRLARMGVRLGVGPSLRYLRKNRSTVGSLLGGGGYDASGLVDELTADAATALAGLHAFTFNQVEATAAWQRAVLDPADGEAAPAS